MLATSTFRQKKTELVRLLKVRASKLLHKVQIGSFLLGMRGCSRTSLELESSITQPYDANGFNTYNPAQR